VYFHKGLSRIQRQAIVLSLHSSLSQLSAEFEGRAYGSGVLKLEPSEAKRIRLLLPDSLDAEKLTACAEAFKVANRANNPQAATDVVDEWLCSGNAMLRQKGRMDCIRSLLKNALQRRRNRT
jgi:hypothetical protein